MEGRRRKPLDLQLENQLVEWIYDRMRCNGSSLHRETTAAQQYPERVVDKLILYILHARKVSVKYKYPPSSIIAMDQTSVWNDMVSNTTID